MIPLQTVLAATDLSAPARHALMRATYLAQQSGARLELLHVMQGGALHQLKEVLGLQAETILPRIEEDTRAQLMRLAEETCAPMGIDAGVHLTSGSVLPEISAMADQLAAGLLVLGARGAGFMRHLLLGATAERMLRMTSRPMLVVKQVPHEHYRCVLLALDFSRFTGDVIAWARANAPNAILVLLHVYDVPWESHLRFAGVDEETIRQYRARAELEAERRLHEAARAAGLAADGYRALVVHGEPAQRILEQEEEQGVDLIAVGKHGENLAEELLLGSVTKHVLAESKGDVLVVR